MQIASTSTSIYTLAQKAAATATAASRATTDQASGAPGDRTTLSDAAKQKLEAQQQALEQLKQLPRMLNDNAKANAQQRVSRLKKMIQQLRMMAAGNPKQMAKMVAQLAKELQAAAKEYTRAGGSQADAGVSGSDTAPGASEEAKSGETDDASKSAAQADSEATADEADAEAAAASAEGTDKTDEAEKADGKDADQKDAETAGDKAASSDPQQQSKDELTKRYEAAAQANGDAKARDEFFQDVREVEKKLRQMLDEIKAAAKRQHKPDDKDVTDTEKALADIDKVISGPSDATAAAGAAIPGSNVNVSI